MNKITISIILYILYLVTIIIACPDKPVDKPKPDIVKDNPKVIVTFNTNGGSDIVAKKVLVGKTIAKPDDTTKKDFTLSAGTKTRNTQYHLSLMLIKLLKTSLYTQTGYLIARFLQELGSDTWRMISAGLDHSIGIQTNGTLWGWGWNQWDKLCVKDQDKTALHTSPTAVIVPPPPP